jgi:hypothetical protein
MVAVFLLRIDSVTNKPEGEVYFATELGITNCNVWNSPKLVDNQVIIANGKKAINEVYETYSEYNITKY